MTRVTLLRAANEHFGGLEREGHRSPGEARDTRDLSPRPPRLHSADSRARPPSAIRTFGRTLDFIKVPKREKAEVPAAVAAHKDEVTAGYVAGAKRD